MDRWSRVFGRLVCIGAAVCFLSSSSIAAAATFGIGDIGLATYGDSSSFHTLCGWNGTSCGHGGLNLRYARLNVPYDSLATYDSTTGSCVDTSSDPNNWIWHNGTPSATSPVIQGWLAEALKDGLRPMLSITSAVPSLTAAEGADN